MIGCWILDVPLMRANKSGRTKHLFDEFGRAFYDADVVRIVDVYAAGEDPIEGINSQSLASSIERFGHKDVRYIGATTGAAVELKPIVREGDLVITLGAGNVWQVGEELLKIL